MGIVHIRDVKRHTTRYLICYTVKVKALAVNEYEKFWELSLEEEKLLEAK
jgi:hypothetical protein